MKNLNTKSLGLKQKEAQFGLKLEFLKTLLRLTKSTRNRLYNVSKICLTNSCYFLMASLPRIGFGL